MGSATTPTVVSIATMPTSMTDAEATRLGLKSYSHGTTYNGGIAPTITGIAGLVVTRSKFIPYQMQDGTWRLKFNARITCTSISTLSFSITGVTVESTSLNYQAFSTSQQNFAGGGRGEVDSSTWTISYSSAFTQASMSGDIELASKPTWAF